VIGLPAGRFESFKAELSFDTLMGLITVTQYVVVGLMQGVLKRSL